MNKKMAAWILIAALCFGLAGCADGQSNSTADSGAAAAPSQTGSAPAAGTPAESEEKVNIQFMHSMVEQDRVDTIQKICDDFNAANANITVEQVPVDEDSYQTKITALGGSGELPETMELNYNFAKLLAKNDFLDYDAIQTSIDAIGIDNFYEGALDALKTEDGANYTAIPMAGWVQGIWYNRKAFDEKGLKAPQTWEEIIAAANAFHDPANKKYGIAIPTANVSFTEQVFSQFALSNEANVFDAQGKANFNTPEMKAALEYYKELAQYTMPGSNEVTQVRDAFMSGAAPMAMYSTYILRPVYEAGFAEDLGFVIPQNKDQAAFGSITGVGISADLPDAKKAAAIKFSQFLLNDTNNVSWVHMSPGGMQPVIKSVATSSEYLENDILKAFSGISADISNAFGELKMFGSVDGKNFVNMGDVTAKNIVSGCVYDIVVQGADIDGSMNKAQKDIEAITN